MDFLKRILITFMFSIASWTGTSVAIGQTIVVKPYIQNVTDQSTVIMWEVASSGGGSVLYGTDPFVLSNSVVSTSIIGNGTSQIHSALIINLLPKTKYYYKVRMGDGQSSALYHFTTYKSSAGEENINFVAVSDMQQDASNPTVFTTLINQGIFPVTDSAIIGGRFGLHGMLIPGDLVQSGGIYNEWRNTFFIPSENFSAHIPMYPVLGNHEYFGGSGGPSTFRNYFSLPLNGPTGLLEQAWYKDFSNIRVIGLNSNTNNSDFLSQLAWLETTLDDVCNDSKIDFVFAQLHHPFHSELWTPGELSFTGDVIQKMEQFSQDCGKATIHFFGHTHAYSRGQSRDHSHHMINVATAGGAIDNWGEFPNFDYPEYSISTDDYGFVLVEGKAGIDPQLRIRRFSRGDNIVASNNLLVDEFVVKNSQFSPQKPTCIFPSTSVLPSCVKLKASAFSDPGLFHQASRWQVAPTCGFATITADVWKQNTNWYNEVNTQANDDLTDQDISNLVPNSSYCWRVRYRNQYLEWSDWSEGQTFTTLAQAFSTPNLIANGNGEAGSIAPWSGQIEVLTDNECNSVPVFEGTRMFAVGGVCNNESSIGLAFQDIDVASYASGIDTGGFDVTYSAYMRGFQANNDNPQMFLQFYDANQIKIGDDTQTITSSTAVWTPVFFTSPVPSGTRSIKTMLRGVRSQGSDNDSYFDNVSLRLGLTNPCLNCAGNGADIDGDLICSDLDCDDTNANINPGALELCDGIDNNCDGLTDAGSTVTWSGSAGNTDWATGANWSQGFPPLPCQHVIIPSPAIVDVRQNPTILSLTINPGATVNIDNGAIMNIGTTGQPLNQACLINGTLSNHGKLYVKRSPSNGIIVNGTLNNHHLLLISDINSLEFITGPTGQIYNVGELLIEK